MIQEAKDMTTKGGVTDNGGSLGWQQIAPKLCVVQVRHVFPTNVHVMKCNVTYILYIELR